MQCPSIVKKTPVMKESHQLRDNEPQTIEKTHKHNSEKLNFCRIKHFCGQLVVQYDMILQ